MTRGDALAEYDDEIRKHFTGVDLARARRQIVRLTAEQIQEATYNLRAPCQDSPWENVT